MLHDRLDGLDEAARKLAVRAADAQRFERETAAVAETFVSEGDAVRRLLLIGMGGSAGRRRAVRAGRRRADRAAADLGRDQGWSSTFTA